MWLTAIVIMYTCVDSLHNSTISESRNIQQNNYVNDHKFCNSGFHGSHHKNIIMHEASLVNKSACIHHSNN